MATVELSSIEISALKQLALVSHALAITLSDKKAARTQLALVGVLTDIVRRAEHPIPVGRDE